MAALPAHIEAKAVLDAQCAQCGHPQAELVLRRPLSIGERMRSELIGQPRVVLEVGRRLPLEVRCPACGWSVRYEDRAFDLRIVEEGEEADRVHHLRPAGDIDA